MSAPHEARVYLRYEVPRTRPDWTLPEEPVPESQPHDQTLDLLKALLLAWVTRTGRAAQVARNLAVRWDRAHPNRGMDPDLCLIEPPTPEGDDLESLSTWEPGHSAPRLAIEVVSSKAQKDYAQSPEKCAAAGVEELWVFDAKLRGPRRGGGPHRIQIWRRRAEGAEGDREFDRVYAGEGPAWSALTGAWLFAVHEGQRLRLAEDREGTRWWPTAEEAERAAKEAERAAKEAERAAKEAERAAREAERAAKEAERAAKEAALARVAELEAQLARR